MPSLECVRIHDRWVLRESGVIKSNVIKMPEEEKDKNMFAINVSITTLICSPRVSF